MDIDDNDEQGEAISTATPPEAAASNANIPTIAQGQQMHEIPRLVHLCNEYCNGYADRNTSVETHLSRAKMFAEALLAPLYPQDQGFRILPASFDNMARHGWSIQEKGAQVTDVDRPPWPFPGHKDRYHLIPRHCICGFGVHKLVDGGIENGQPSQKLQPHTFLAIMIDDLRTMPWWLPVSQSANCRGDILALSLGQQIREGYGIVIIGTCVEFYQFSLETFNPMKTFEPLKISKLVGENVGGRKVPELVRRELRWHYDMKDADLAAVSDAFERAAMQDIIYANWAVGEGSKKITDGESRLRIRLK
jgi:hypothetical protein